ncbi:hypothetical protein KM043_000387 [Ampulex compressa]|nr:hypothetical protein KM043_000387 [Ampulex compressa]
MHHTLRPDVTRIHGVTADMALLDNNVSGAGGNTGGDCRCNAWKDDRCRQRPKARRAASWMDRDESRSLRERAASTSSTGTKSLTPVRRFHASRASDSFTAS